MHPNAALIERFYRAFDGADAETMVACYHPDVSFEDPVFGELRGQSVGAMWRMLVGRATDLRVEARDVAADDTSGSATWIATYTFGLTGRRVRNVIRARFAFRDGLVVEHRDRFSLWRWAGMALGPIGWTAGWTPALRARVRRDARRQLDRFARKDARA